MAIVPIREGNTMRAFLIYYTGLQGNACVDIQRAATMVEALVQHKASFPHSRHAAARKLKN